ncbi:Bromodomain containing protein [Tritrichomonas foetus]|uniref:Bromodomain containing protein n=1 Tax=Tritrichomonas foetus TaxID=1144522 RepID=A0A1J4KIK6_9EUKA|nr:Bromodomain containing protein [Tritrichomonas foetus]|eukprot:OHT09534.1 Bromodomain containing protein [Tritrichomonas foetus]
MKNEEEYNKFKRKALKIIRKIRTLPDSQFFINPIDLSNPETLKYPRNIPHAITLVDVSNRIMQNYYAFPNEFKNDVNQIFNNAKIFFANPDNPYHKAANELQAAFDIEAAKLPHILTQEEHNNIAQRYVELRILRYCMNKQTHT